MSDATAATLTPLTPLTPLAPPAAPLATSLLAREVRRRRTFANISHPHNSL